MKILSKRIISALLAAMTTVGTVACADSQPENNTETNVGDTQTGGTESVETEAVETDATETGRAAVSDNLPSDLNLNGRSIRILARSGDKDTRLEFLADEESGDIVEDAVYKRNLTVCERLNVTLDVIEVNEERHSGAGINDLLTASVMAGSDDYDLVANHLGQLSPLILQGIFQNMYDLPYIDWDQPWWNQSYNDAVTIGGKRYACAGELSLSMIMGIYATFFNKQLWDNYYNDQDLYEIVKSGDWTLDKLTEFSTGVYEDINGDGAADEGDTFGMSYILDSIQADAFAAGAGVSFTEYSDGKYTWALENEHTADFLGKMEKLLFDKSTLLTTNLDAFQTTLLDKMKNDSALFIVHMLSGTELLRDMVGDYGIVPMPKFDASQSDYKTTVHNGSSVFAIPATAVGADEIAAVLEALCSESYRMVTPAYFDVALKVKYARDDSASEMLDICIDSISFDFAYLFNSAIGSNAAIFRSLLKSENIGSAMSTIASKKSEVDSKLAEIVTAYGELE